MTLRSSLRTHLGLAYRNFLAPLHYRASRAELHRLLRTDLSARALWHITRTYRGYGWFRDLSAWQVEDEYCGVVDWVAMRTPRIILEIGTAKGATLLAWSRIASELVISVDLPGGIHGGGYPAVKEKLFQVFVSDRPGVELLTIRGDSHSAELRDHVRATLAGRGVDFLFIDADHRYDGVARDFELWSPLVSSGGHIAFHDILPHRVLKDCEVNLLWDELKPHFNTTEFISDPEQGWAGIGILEVA
jgi:cephalosporin hydroxylase